MQPELFVVSTELDHPSLRELDGVGAVLDGDHPISRADEKRNREVAMTRSSGVQVRNFQSLSGQDEPLPFTVRFPAIIHKVLSLKQ